MTTKESLAVDIDDVLANHAEAFAAFSNANYGTNITADDYTEQWAHLWGVQYEEVERRATEFHIPESVAAYEVKAESDEALRILGGHYDLFIVTARPEHLLDTTRTWIDAHFPGIFKDVHFVPFWVPGNTVTKADICQQIGAHCLIDDLARHCNAAAAAGLKAVLFGDYNWNRNEKLEDGIVRCINWPAVLSHLGLNNGANILSEDK